MTMTAAAKCRIRWRRGRLAARVPGFAAFPRISEGEGQAGVERRASMLKKALK